eukprot:GFUD01030865.1.p1 GENE.GFUD01030865.1~~GFUD01030865.1.p1  ORF type:complete len:213 (-),score=66.69 GFUD01030865.1:159-719(-)
MSEREELKIIQIEDEAAKVVLRRRAEEVSFPLSITDQATLLSMEAVLHKLGGVGLAAPQVQISKRIALIYIPTVGRRSNAKPYPMHAIINPEYVGLGEDGAEDRVKDMEGCYSVKSICGLVPRYNRVRLTYQDKEGRMVEKEEEGFYARVLQHEIDHLNGTLIIDRLEPCDRMNNLKNPAPEELLA